MKLGNLLFSPRHHILRYGVAVRLRKATRIVFRWWLRWGSGSVKLPAPFLLLFTSDRDDCNKVWFFCRCFRYWPDRQSFRFRGPLLAVAVFDITKNIF